MTPPVSFNFSISQPVWNYDEQFKIASATFGDNVLNVLIIFSWWLLIQNLILMVFHENFLKISEKSGIFLDQSILYSIYFGINLTVIIFQMVIFYRLQS